MADMHPETAIQTKETGDANHRTETLHQSEPDYSRGVFKFTQHSRQRIFGRLRKLYGSETALDYLPELERICRVYHAHKPQALIDREKGCRPTERFTQQDIILITYGDLIKGGGRSPLASLGEFCQTYLEGSINTLHILPFFPYSSDRGFSITDFESVDPKLGAWQDIWNLENDYQLMFDGVINHVSSKSRWFQEFLNGNPYYKDFFIAYDSPDELTEAERELIFRPRTSDILTPFQTINGVKWVWTTFSTDQIDLNYKNPNLLMRVIEILLLYVRNGADIIRMDAVTYLWAETGTTCAHLEQTHEVVKLFRDILDAVAPGVAIITETNVPHKENISYFGDGGDEAHMVYNFALPPLVLHTFYSHNATELSNWAESLTLSSPTCHFFNFLDSHDGIGVMGVKGILSQEQIGALIDKAKDHGAFISYKTGKDGEKEPYEMNITWFSALSLDADQAGEDTAFQVKRFVASRIISMILQGVPGIYLHSLIGTLNDVEAVMATNSNRDINRRVIDEQAIKTALLDPLSKVSRIGRELGRLITLRAGQRAFHPNGDQKILRISPRVFSVLRTSPGGEQTIVALVNVTDSPCNLQAPLAALGRQEENWLDLVSDMEWMADRGVLNLTLLPYDVMWLEPFDPETR